MSKSLFFGASVSLLIKLSAAGLSFAIQVLLARTLGVTQFGIYVYVIAWLNTIVLVSKAGLDTSLVRYIAEYEARKEWELMRGLLYKSVQITVATSAVACVLAIIFIMASVDDTAHDLTKTFLISLMCVPLMGILGVRQAALKGFKHVLKADSLDILVKQLVFASLIVLVFYFFDLEPDSSTLMAINIASIIAVLILAEVWSIKYFSKEVSRVKPKYRTIEWLRVSAPLLLLSGMNLVLSQADIILIGVFLGTDEAGIYTVVVKISSLVAFGLFAVNSIVAPVISEKNSMNKIGDLQRIVSNSSIIIFIFTLTFVLIVAVFGKYLLVLFGEEFAIGYSSLLFLLVGYSVNALTGPVGVLMTMTGHQGQAAKIVGGGVILNIVLNVILIPRYALEGAAVATSISMIVWNVLMCLSVRKNLLVDSTILEPISRIVFLRSKI